MISLSLFPVFLPQDIIITTLWYKYLIKIPWPHLLKNLCRRKWVNGWGLKFRICVETSRGNFETTMKCILLLRILPKLYSFDAHINHCHKKWIWYKIVHFSKFSRHFKVQIAVLDGWNNETEFYSNTYLDNKCHERRNKEGHAESNKKGNSKRHFLGLCQILVGLETGRKRKRVVHGLDGHVVVSGQVPGNETYSYWNNFEVSFNKIEKPTPISGVHLSRRTLAPSALAFKFFQIEYHAWMSFSPWQCCFGCKRDRRIWAKVHPWNIVITFDVSLCRDRKSFCFPIGWHWIILVFRFDLTCLSHDI